MNIYRGGTWGCYRHLKLDNHSSSTSLQVEHAYVNALIRGDLASLSWIEGPLTYYRCVRNQYINNSLVGQIFEIKQKTK